MKVVLDSNILLVAVGKRSNYRPIWNAFLDGRFQLIVSEDVIFEYEEILRQRSAPGVAPMIMEIFIESPEVIYQKIYYLWNAIKNDPDDNKFFDIAVAANADYLVTNDAHFNIIKELNFPKIKIITAEEFLKILAKS
ncbi:MAG TPA: putative toxin-antitoxin system toxin component, PIN family [Mucilaginibacter sp.]|jgi:putative PIN family toxin of toxin-antitoxin system|nr:putative toxin-antitoxin system toxin component, PIN family [Mucilaginibacter sp.]